MGHSSHVTKVKFSADDKYIVTTGGHDKTVLIWENYYGVHPSNAQANGGEEEVYFV
jgi:microtubule-associated protein-like 6